MHRCRHERSQCRRPDRSQRRSYGAIGWGGREKAVEINHECPTETKTLSHYDGIGKCISYGYLGLSTGAKRGVHEGS